MLITPIVSVFLKPDCDNSTNKMLVATMVVGGDHLSHIKFLSALGGRLPKYDDEN